MVGREDNERHTLALAALNVRSLSAHSVDVTRDFILKDLRFLCFSETWSDERIEVTGHTGTTRAQPADEKPSCVAIDAHEHLAFETIRAAVSNLTARHHRLCGLVWCEDQ